MYLLTHSLFLRFESITVFVKSSSPDYLLIGCTRTTWTETHKQWCIHVFIHLQTYYFEMYICTQTLKY